MRWPESYYDRQDPEIIDLDCRISRAQFKVLAGALFLASIFGLCSCSHGLSVADRLDLSKTPMQVIDNAVAVQTENGSISMRVDAGRMERYDQDSTVLELYSGGFNVYAYNEDGLLETVITGDDAMHETVKNASTSDKDRELWKAYGNIVIRNVIKQETMQTDTLYWDTVKGEIYTDCYVRIYAPGGFMQGYGMRSDDRARESTLLKPFNSYGVVVRDSTEVIIDSANFIGPFPTKK